MVEKFTYDVFISHSSKDKPEVRELAERLKADGLSVWFDEWEIKPGDMIGLKIEKGLEQSRTLVLVVTKNGSLCGHEIQLYFTSPTSSQSSPSTSR